MVTEKSQLAALYGEGEIVVNSEHRQALNKVARGFVVGARALDGIIEAIESDKDGWFAMGVQWHPEYKVLENPVSAALFSAFGSG